MIRIAKHVTLFALTALLFQTASSHVDNPMLPEGCGSCHVGHGQPSQPMLKASEEQFCYQCHGSAEKQSAMKSAGNLASDASPVDIEQEFRKIYRHPVAEGTGHSPDERLPDVMRSAVNHAECVDCHNPHQRIHPGGNATYKVGGYSTSGQYLDEATSEAEVCFKCHVGNSVRDDSKNTHLQFTPGVVSQHPVTQRTVNSRTVSLNRSQSAGSLMKCSDCHTSDDPDGPQGPHGSRYRYLLSGNYERDPYADESPFAYEFCYSCHERSSILNNESFPLHREHIVGDPIRNIKGTSCYTCHSSHSSRTSRYLIEFNLDAVSPDQMTGRLANTTSGDGSGQCYLKCHNHSHSPAKY